MTIPIQLLPAGTYQAAPAKASEDWERLTLDWNRDSKIAKGGPLTSTKEPKLPGPEHPITVVPTDQPVVVRAGEKVIAQTHRALTLAEADYPTVQYVPLADVDEAVLSPTDHSTYCPYKGDASYYNVSTPEGELENVVWTYEQPYDAVAEIAGHVAFYTNQVEVSVG